MSTAQSLVLTLALTLGGSVAVAQSGPRHHGPPPKEAVDACSGLSSGATCAVTINNNKVEGTCRGPEGKPLACMPPMGPPPAAVDACSNLSADAACSFTMHGESISGTCKAPQGKPLACSPANMPPPPER